MTTDPAKTSLPVEEVRRQADETNGGRSHRDHDLVLLRDMLRIRRFERHPFCQSPRPRCHFTTTGTCSRIGWLVPVSIEVATSAKSTEYVPGVSVTIPMTP
jgi:hypothetical protein